MAQIESTAWPGDPDCPSCFGVGYYRYDVPVTHPRFGKLYPCECRTAEITAVQTEKETHARRFMLNASGLSEDEFKLSLGDIRDRGAGSRAMLEQGRLVLSEERYLVTVWGPPGNGKSHFLKCLTSEFLRRGGRAIYARMTDLLDYIRAGIKADDYSERVSQLRDVSFLAIDEPDEQKVSRTGWADEQMFALIDSRYAKAKRRECVTVLAMNQNPSTLDQYLYDRLRYGEKYEHGIARIIHNTDPSARSSGI